MTQELLSNTSSSNGVVVLIYCRVSSVSQMIKGHGLGSQETRCREFARAKGYEVVKVFRDEAVSGGLINRPGMQAMLAYARELKKKRPGIEVVILLDEISRLARSLEAHIELRSAIANAGARLESPSLSLVKTRMPSLSNIYSLRSRNITVKRDTSRRLPRVA